MRLDPNCLWRNDTDLATRSLKTRLLLQPKTRHHPLLLANPLSHCSSNTFQGVVVAKTNVVVATVVVGKPPFVARVEREKVEGKLSSITADQLKTSLQQINLFFWHCICVEMMGPAVKYMGGEARTFQLNVDELCWFLLKEFAVKCGSYNKGDHIYYLIPDAETFEKGLRRVYSDDEVRVMSDVMVKFRCISCYVVAAAENYEAQNDENVDGEGPIYGSTGQLLSKEDVDDERIVTRSEKGKSQDEREADTAEDEFVSDYDESGDELNTECEGEDNEVGKRRKKRKCLVVNSSTDFIMSVEDQHTCVRNMESNRQLKSTWLAKQFLELFKPRPHWQAKEIVETIRVAYKVLVKVGFAYKVIYYAHRLLHGSMKEHYSKLGRYLEALKESSPNSYFKLEVDNSTHPATFDKVFFCSDGVKQGWLKGCRKVLCLDGCFLQTFLGGMLLSAIGRDANEQMYPLAWAAVEGETNASWQWFLPHFKKAVGDEMKALFWKAAKAYNEADFNNAIEEMEQVDPGAVIAFKAHNPSLFCRAFVRINSKCDVIMSNMAETFNGYIIHARNKHLIYMLEDIQAALMQRMVLKKTEMEKNPFEICPRVQAKLEKEKEEVAHCLTLPSNVNQFQVNHRMDSLADTYLKTNNGSISPCPGERHWPSVELPLDPPPIKIGPGRPRKNRRKHPMENPKKKGKLIKHGVEMKCSICKSKSHNKRKCLDKDKGPTEEPAPKRRRGRPSKDATSHATLAYEMTSPTHHDEVEEAEVEAAMVEVEVELQLEIEDEVGVEEGEEVGVEEGWKNSNRLWCSVQLATDSKALQANTSVDSKTPQASTRKH
ncbi:Transcription initiation factor TFIID subunit 1 [Bienertia sinuspersici]